MEEKLHAALVPAFVRFETFFVKIDQTVLSNIFNRIYHSRYINKILFISRSKLRDVGKITATCLWVALFDVCSIFCKKIFTV